MLAFSDEKNRKNTLLIAYLATFLSQGFDLSFYYLLFTFFSVDLVGFYSSAIAVVGFLIVIIDLGSEPILTREFGKKTLQLGTAIIAFAITRFPLVLVLFGVGILLFKLEIISSWFFFLLLLIGCWQLLSLVERVFSSFIRANNKQFVVNTIRVVDSFGRFLFAFIVINYVAINPLFFVILGFLFVKCITLFFFIYVSLIENRSNKNLLIRESISINEMCRVFLRSGSTFTGISLLTTTQNRLDWLLVSVLVSPVALASYSLANKFYEIIQMAVGVTLSTAYPWLCKDETMENVQVNLSILLRVLIAAGTLVSLSGAVLLPYLVFFIFQKKYVGVNEPIQILMVAASLITASGFFYYLILSKGKEVKILPYVFLATVLQLLFNLLFIPRIGIAGASIGMLVLVVATLVGLTLIVLTFKLLSSSIVHRILIFYDISLLLYLFLLRFQSAIWINFPLILISVGLIAWYVLFGKADRQFIWVSIINIFYSRKENKYA